jgi:hypothetical protein
MYCVAVFFFKNNFCAESPQAAGFIFWLKLSSWRKSYMVFLWTLFWSQKFIDFNLSKTIYLGKFIVTVLVSFIFFFTLVGSSIL